MGFSVKKYRVTIRDLLIYTKKVEVIAKNKKEAFILASQDYKENWESEFYKTIGPIIEKISDGV